MRINFLLLFLLLVVSSYGAVLILHSNLISKKENVQSSVIKALDNQKVEKTHTSETDQIEVNKADLAHSVSHYLIQYINRKIGLKAERVDINEQDLIKLVTTNSKMNCLIMLKIKEVKIISRHKPLRSIKVNLILEMTVLDEAGREIYHRIVMGDDEKHIQTEMIEKASEELIKSVVKDTLGQYLKDPKLKKVIAKFKYGAVGRAIAYVF